MFERFTNKARHVVVVAQEVSRARRGKEIGVPDLILGVLKEDGTLAQAFLQAAGITESEVAAYHAPAGTEVLTGHIPYTPQAKRCLELSFRIALQAGHNWIGVEHVLIGIIWGSAGAPYGKPFEDRLISRVTAFAALITEDMDRPTYNPDLANGPASPTQAKPIEVARTIAEKFVTDYAASCQFLSDDHRRMFDPLFQQLKNQLGR